MLEQKFKDPMLCARARSFQLTIFQRKLFQRTLFRPARPRLCHYLSQLSPSVARPALVPCLPSPLPSTPPSRVDILKRERAKASEGERQLALLLMQQLKDEIDVAAELVSSLSLQAEQVNRVCIRGSDVHACVIEIAQ